MVKENVRKMSARCFALRLHHFERSYSQLKLLKSKAEKPEMPENSTENTKSELSKSIQINQ